MKIVVAGGTGFIGRPLVSGLVARGDDVVVLTRNPGNVQGARGVAWRPPSVDAWADEVSAADAVINLAGESIADGRWTAARKQRLVSSRLDATSALVEALRLATDRERCLVSASAIGFYGLSGDERLDEGAPQGRGFLAGLSAKWEAAAREAEPRARVVLLRFGIVLDRSGGALAKMLLPFSLGLGGPVGDGKQWMSWVGLEDVIRGIAWALDTQAARGVYNLTAPEPVRSRDFARALGRALHRPAILPVPAFALRAMFGEMADEILIGGQRVIPARLEKEAFRFERIALDDELRALFAR